MKNQSCFICRCQRVVFHVPVLSVAPGLCVCTSCTQKAEDPQVFNEEAKHSKNTLFWLHKALLLSKSMQNQPLRIDKMWWDRKRINPH